jgi:DNA-binding LacI/PurR family transcriptional regulator
LSRTKSRRLLKERGLCIPEDVAIVGFDNQERIAAYLRSALSSVALPHYEMGQWAVGHLMEQTEQQVKRGKGERMSAKSWLL